MRKKPKVSVLISTWNRSASLARCLDSLMPHPGSKLYETALKEGWLRYSPGEWERWDMSEPVLKSADTSPGDKL